MIVGSTAFLLLRSSDDTEGLGGASKEFVSPTELLVSDQVSVAIEVEFLSPAEGGGAFTGRLDVDTESGSASGAFDMTGIDNDSGTFGDHDEVKAAFQLGDSYFEIVPGDKPWLHVGLSEASITKNRYLFVVRGELLANPFLSLGLLEAADVDLSTADKQEFSFTGREARDEVQGGVSEALALLEEQWLLEDVRLVASISSEGLTRLVTTWRYPVVPSSQDLVKVKVIFKFEATESTPVLPSEDEVTEYAALASETGS